MPKNRTRSNINQRAKSFEKAFAKFLSDNGIPAEWVDRENWGDSDTDVKVVGFPQFQIDCKTQTKGWSHHTKFEDEVINRYCHTPEDRAIMPTKAKDQRGCYVTITDKFFVELLRCFIERGNVEGPKRGSKATTKKEAKIEL